MNEAEKESRPTDRAESRAGRFFRRVFRWAVGLLAVFALGAGTVLLTLYLPSAEEARGAERQVVELEAERDDLARQLKSEKTEGQTLRTELDAARLYVAVLSVLLDVTGARLALVSDDPASARVYLSKAPAMLENLAALLDEEQRSLVAPMQKRLREALENLESDHHAAQSDLDVLSNTLTQQKMNLLWAFSRDRR